MVIGTLIQHVEILIYCFVLLGIVLNRVDVIEFDMCTEMKLTIKAGEKAPQR